MYYENKLWILIEYCEGGALDDIIEKIDHGKGLQTIPTMLNHLQGGPTLEINFSEILGKTVGRAMQSSSVSYGCWSRISPFATDNPS